jgi:excisionase family DNA binding protein
MGRRIRRSEAAEYLGIARATLAKWATTGGGPSFMRLGGAVVYDTADLDAWVAERRRANTSERGMR